MKISQYILGIIILGLLIIFVMSKEPSKVEAQTTPWKFVVYADSQYSYSVESLQRSVDAIRNTVSGQVFTVGVGDLTLNGKVTDAATNSMDWTRWKAALSNLVTSWTQTNPPQHIGVWGDHDTDRNNLSGWLSLWSYYMAAQKNLTAYSDVASHPSGLYGSFKYQNALILWLTSAEPSEETLITNATSSSFFSAQETYLSTILNRASTDASVKWKFVFFHNPAEACNIGTKIDNERTKAWFNNYFVRYGVDMVFNGHTHSYLRTCPLLSLASGNSDTVTCENFTDNQVGDPGGVIEVMATPISTAPTLLANCPAKRFAAVKRMFASLEITGNVLTYKAWNIDDGGVNPTSLDSLTIDKSQAPTSPILVKRADKTSVRSGDLINYTITYTNGNQTVTGVTVTDPLPANTEFVPCSGCGQLIGNNVTWTYNDWAPGESGDLIFQVRVK